MSYSIPQINSLKPIQTSIIVLICLAIAIALVAPTSGLILTVGLILLYVVFNKNRAFNIYLFLLILSLILEKYSYYVGFSIRLPLLFITLTVLYFVFNNLLKGRIVIKNSYFIALFTLLFLNYILGTIWAIQPVKVIRVSVLYVFLFGIFLIAQHISDNRSRILLVNKYFITVGLLGATYGIYQVIAFFFNLPAQLPLVESLKHSDIYTIKTTAFQLAGVIVPRINSTFNDPVLIGAFSAFSLMLLLGRIAWLHKNSNFPLSRKVSFSAAALVLFFCCILTFSRSAWLGLILGLLTISFFFLRYKKTSRLIVTSFSTVAIAFIILFTIFPPMSDFIVGRFSQSFDISHHSTFGHLKWFNIAVEAWSEHPILGVGLNNFGEFYAQKYQASSMAMTHSAYFSFLAESGTIGFLLELTLIGFILHHLIVAISRARRVRHYEFYFLLSGIIGAYVTILAANITYHFYTQFYVWFFMGFAVATASYVMRELSGKTLVHR